MMDLYILIGILYSLATSPVTARDSHGKKHQVMYIMVVSLTKTFLWPLAALSWALVDGEECFRCGGRIRKTNTVYNEYGRVRVTTCSRCGSVLETR